MEHWVEHIILFSATFVTGFVFIRSAIGNQKWVKYLLSFSGAFLFALTVLHFIPEVYHETSWSVGVFVLLGFSLQIVLEFMSQGLDHGHGHGAKSIRWPAMVGLFIHALIEATPLAAHQHHHHALHGHDGVSDFLLFGLVMHKIPVAIVLATLIGQHKGLKGSWKAYALLFSFSMMAPLGLFFAGQIDIIHQFHEELMGVVIGIFLYISTTILFEVNEAHKFNQRKFISILIGFGLAYLASV